MREMEGERGRKGERQSGDRKGGCVGRVWKKKISGRQRRNEEKKEKEQGKEDSTRRIFLKEQLSGRKKGGENLEKNGRKI